MDQNGQEQIEVVGTRIGNGRWSPAVGAETMELLNGLSMAEASRQVIRNEAVSILTHCTPPNEPVGCETGLVLGYIQSGKTLSFTTVSALARDNRYPLIIVIVGISKPLTEQSRRRLRKDLRLDEREDRSWRHLHNPRLLRQDQDRVARFLEDWRDESVPMEYRATMLITVMKQHRHLNHLVDVLSRVHLAAIPVLIVDDEADQAGLNNFVKEGKESTTYQCLRRLKDAIPHHTFLQYTATPQGPLLINLIDVLSPGFASILTPGPEYAGGRDFFLDQPGLTREIPPAEISTPSNRLNAPPDSLLEALRLFFLGVASGWIRDTGRGNRSMMVHPSRRTIGHQQYHTWVRTICSHWRELLARPDEQDTHDLIEEFRSSYHDLRLTVPDLEPFDQLMQRMVWAIRNTDIHLVNTTRGSIPQIDWRSMYAHILVGGQALDRGFTVEGLTVTYMPRDVGAKRADTIQQRARFFGYKRPYLGYCRVFLEPAVRDAFTKYVSHEEDIRNRLREYEGRPLDELRRAFLLPQGLAPTRDSIIDVSYVRTRVSDGWFYPNVPYESNDAVEMNRRVIADFLRQIELSPDQGHGLRTPTQRHLFAGQLSLREVYSQLILGLRFPNLSDAQNLLGVIVIIRQLLDANVDEMCTLYQMSGGHPRERTLDADGKIRQLLQGAYPVNPPARRGEIYPGDRAIHDGNSITIQIHNLNIKKERTGPVVFPQIPDVAIWIPPRSSNDVLIQNQGGLQESDE